MNTSSRPTVSEEECQTVLLPLYQPLAVTNCESEQCVKRDLLALPLPRLLVGTLTCQAFRSVPLSMLDLDRQRKGRPLLDEIRAIVRTFKSPPTFPQLRANILTGQCLSNLIFWFAYSNGFVQASHREARFQVCQIRKGPSRSNATKNCQLPL